MSTELVIYLQVISNNQRSWIRFRGIGSLLEWADHYNYLFKDAADSMHTAIFEQDSKEHCQWLLTHGDNIVERYARDNF